MQPVADLRTAASVLAGHPDAACQRVAHRIGRILAGEDARAELGADMIAHDRERRRDEELRKWLERRFSGCSQRGAVRMMESLWKNYLASNRARLDADLTVMPAEYVGTHREHLFVLEKLGVPYLSWEGIRRIIR